MKKRLVALLAVLALLATMIVPVAFADDKTTLRITWWGSQTRHDLTMKAIELFEQKNPNIKVEPEFTSWDSYWSKLATQVAGGQTPDVIQMDRGYLAQYTDSNVLAPLDEYFASGAIDISNLPESAVNSGKVGDKVYAMTIGTNAQAFMYRKDVLDEAGVEMPMEPTCEQIADIARTVYEKTGRKLDTTEFRNLTLDVRARGYQYFDPDGTKLGFTDPQFIADMWQFYVTSIEEGWGMDVTEKEATSKFDILVHDTWATLHWTNEINALEENSGCELSLAMPPVPEGQTVAPLFTKPSQFWSISATSNVKDAAAAWINFFTNDTECYDIVGTDRAVPASSVVLSHLEETTTSVSDKKVFEYLGYIGQEGKTSDIMAVEPSAQNEVGDKFTDYFEAVQYGQVTDLLAWATQLMGEANQILADAAKAE